MKANIMHFSNNSYLVAARQMLERGEITIEDYAQMLRRNID